MERPSPKQVLTWLARVLTGLITAGVVSAGVLLVWLETGERRVPETTVRDVTELVEIDVQRVATPRSADEVRKLLASHDGPVSIGGGRFSMGGQIATDDTLFLDLREMDDVLALDVENRTIRVETGATWRDVIEAVDPHDLSVSIMQSYANFTVGGTISVNAHGRYMGQGPVAHSVRSLDVVFADGSWVRASRDENPNIFWGAIGGYGALGVIVAAELDLAENTKLERTVERMPRADFVRYWTDEASQNEDAVFFNADLYPPAYDELVAITFAETDRDVTVEERLQPGGESSRTDKFMYWWVSEAPLGKQARSELIDRMRLASKPVVWRNYEASYDVASLDPGSRKRNTYVLQEYFIPIERFDTFAPKMADIFTEHDVNVVNVSIRHAIAEPDSLLSWAPRECYAFVIYYKMGTSPEDWDHAGTWTRAMADAILEEEGTWYLPYQIHATPEQFRAAYPRADELFALKKLLDPDYTFRNRLWDRYLPPTPDYGGQDHGDVDAIRAKLAARDTWARPEDQTFLTLPEWLIVYSADETGAFLAENRPSAFPWFAAIGQFWTSYRQVWGTVRERYPFNTGYHGMIWVIGASYTAEYGVKGLYEHTLGRLFEALGGGRTAEEDHYAQVTADYGAFTHHTPWYAFPFAERRAEIGDLPATGSWLRRTERRLVERIELTLKSWWGGAMGGASGAAYGAQAETLEVWVRPDADGEADLKAVDGVEVLEDLGHGNVLVSIPRYEPFTAAVLDLTARGVELVEIAGGDLILVQVQADAGWSEAPLWGDVLVEWTMLSDPERQRVAFEVPVERLEEVLPALRREADIDIERLYDF